MGFRLEGLAHLGSRAGEINEHAARINHIDTEAVRFEPCAKGVKVRLRYTELFAKLQRGEPVMKIGRILVVEFVNKLLES